MIGHSLGGRILETTITRSLMDNVSLKNGGAVGKSAARLKKPADLVLLINPASDGLRARQTLMAVQWAPKSKLPKTQVPGQPTKPYSVPLIISVRSTTDKATGGIYEAAMRLWKWPRKTRTYPTSQGHDHSQYDYITKTGPTLPHLVSHKLDPLKTDSNSQMTLEGTALDYNLSSKVAINRFPLTLDEKKIGWYGITPDVEGDFKIYDPKPETRRGAYWVMKVPPEVLAGHGGNKELNGIFSNTMIDFFAALYSVSIPADEHDEPRKTTDDKVPSSVPYLATPKQLLQPLRSVQETEKEALPLAP